MQARSQREVCGTGSRLMIFHGSLQGHPKDVWARIEFSPLAYQIPLVDTPIRMVCWLHPCQDMLGLLQVIVASLRSMMPTSWPGGCTSLQSSRQEPHQWSLRPEHGLLVFTVSCFTSHPWALTVTWTTVISLCACLSPKAEMTMTPSGTRSDLGPMQHSGESRVSTWQRHLVIWYQQWGPWLCHSLGYSAQMYNLRHKAPCDIWVIKEKRPISIWKDL